MKRILLAGVLLLSLGACGTTATDRAISGGAIGAGVGAVGGYMLGSPVEGALIGGAVGADEAVNPRKRAVDVTVIKQSR